MENIENKDICTECKYPKHAGHAPSCSFFERQDSNREVTVENKKNEVKFIEKEGFGKSIKRYDLQNEDGKIIGELELNYSRKTQTVALGMIEFDENFRGKGYGKQVYKNIAEISEKEGYIFRSSDDSISESARRVWESLIKEGLAEKNENYYRIIKK